MVVPFALRRRRLWGIRAGTNGHTTGDPATCLTGCTRVGDGLAPSHDAIQGCLEVALDRGPVTAIAPGRGSGELVGEALVARRWRVEVHREGRHPLAVHREPRIALV